MVHREKVRDMEAGKRSHIVRTTLLLLLLGLVVNLLWSRPGYATKKGRHVILWEPLPMPQGVQINNVLSLLVVSPDDRVLVLGTWDGIYRTSDRGRHWQKVLSAWISRIAVAPGNPTRVYASGGPSFYASSDGGRTWRVSSAPSLCAFAVAPDDVNHLYAASCWGSEESSIYVSHDGGQTWAKVATNPFIEEGEKRFVEALSVSSDDASLIFASTWGSLFRSIDGGRSWQTVMQGYAIGRVYVSPQNATFYLPEWRGLWKSVDQGQTWLASGVGSDLSTLVSPPWNPNALWTGGAGGTWLVLDKGTRWVARKVGTPGQVKQMIRGHTTLYALTSLGIWRAKRVSQPGTSKQFIPATYSSAYPYSSTTSDARAALARANYYRALVGVPPLVVHPALIQAAQNHARYYVLNSDRPEMAQLGAHSEIPNTPGFTGETPSKRAVYAGYPENLAYVWEDMHFIFNPVRSVDEWVAAPFHRLAVIHPSLQAAGYGRAQLDSVRADVFDVAPWHMTSGTWLEEQYVLVYPVPGQTDIPTAWHGREVPNPLPSGASGPVGYPISLHGLGGKMTVARAQLTDAAGNPVDVYPNSSYCDSRNCYFLIARHPLQPHMTYTVRVEGTIGGKPFRKEWQFTTGPEEVCCANVQETPQ